MSFAAVGFAKSFFLAYQTQTAGTVIKDYVPPNQYNKSKITLLKYITGTTAHTVTVLRPLAKTTVKTAAAAAATALVLTRDPGNYSANATADGKSYTPSVANNLIAANDWFLLQKPDGTWLLDKPSAVAAAAADGSVSLTVSALPTGGILAGAAFYFFGITTDTNPNDGKAHPFFTSTTDATSGTDTWGDGAAALIETCNENEPLMVHSNNATSAGKLVYGSGIYGP